MESYVHILNPFFIVFSILQLLVYLTFFIKVKTDIRYSIIWLLALWTTAIVVVYVFTFLRRKPCCDEPIEVPEDLLVFHDVTIQKWAAIMTFWQLLDQNINVLQVIKSACNYTKTVIPGLVIFTITTFARKDYKTLGLFEDNTLAVSMCIPLIIFFLIIAWKSAAGKQEAFLLFGIIFTQLPLSSTVKILMPYLNEYPLFQASTSQKIQDIVLFGATMAETTVIGKLIGDTYHGKVLWPGLKAMAKPHDVENVRENSDAKDIGRLVNTDKAID